MLNNYQLLTSCYNIVTQTLKYTMNKKIIVAFIAIASLMSLSSCYYHHHHHRGGHPHYSNPGHGMYHPGGHGHYHAPRHGHHR